MTGRRLLLLLAISSLVAIGAATCGGDDEEAAPSPPAAETEAPADTSAAPSTGETSAPTGAFGVGLQLGEELGEAEVGSSTDPWLVWNRETCSYEEATEHPEAYRAVTRKITGGPTQIGYMHYGDVDPFGVVNSKSVKEVSAEAGFNPVNVYNLKYPSESEPLAQARNSVLKKDAGVIQAQQVASVAPAFFKTLQTEGCIPSIQMYLAVEQAPAFGAVWADVGRTQGTWLAEQALAKEWDPAETALVQCTDPALGEDVNSMFTTGPEALRAGGFDLPADNVYALKCEFTPQKAAVPVTDWLTAHPDVKTILMQTIDDERMAGMLNAMKKADRLGDIIDIASGTDELGQKQIKSGIQQASIGYFPEKYGEWLVPMMEDVMAGNPVPSFVGQGLPVITKDNIQEFYPD
jgi:ribose transport system substrate-binding protein